MTYVATLPEPCDAAVSTGRGGHVDADSTCMSIFGFNPGDSQQAGGRSGGLSPRKLSGRFTRAICRSETNHRGWLLNTKTALT